MHRLIGSVAVLALSTCALSALADDSVSRATPTDRQMMKDCIQRQKTADVTMSKSEMIRICKDQLKQQKQTGTPPEPAPVDPPHN